MRKRIKWAGALVLCLVMALSLAVPAFAASQTTELVVRYAPDGKRQEGVEWRLYRIAEYSDGAYTLTENYKDADFDPAELVDLKMAADNAEAYSAARDFFAAYVQEKGIEPDLTKKTSEGGEAKFFSPEDGLYLMTGDAVTLGEGEERAAYTPVPVLLSLPYTEEDGTVNANLSMSVKFTVSEPVDPPVDPPYNPPDEPETPEVPDDPEIPDEEPDIDLDDEDVPLTDLPAEEEEDIDLEDEDIPLADMPQTGLVWWPVPLLACAGVACVIFGLCTRKEKST